MKQRQSVRLTGLLAICISLLIGCDTQFDQADSTSSLENQGEESLEEIEYFQTLTDLDLMQMQPSRHEALRDCRQCHFRLTAYRDKKFNKPIPQLCYECHDNYVTENEYVHGPIAVGECLFCHRPHVSTFIHLQQVRQPSLCMRCHAMQQQYTLSEVHEENRDKLCTACHDPHGGSDKLFLKN